MTDTVVSSPDFCLLVRAQFASRPTLRQVLSRQLLLALVEQYPLIARQRPELVDADRLSVATPSPDGEQVALRPLVDEVLQACLNGVLLDFPAVANTKPYLTLDRKRLFAIEDPFETADGDQIDLQRLIEPFNDVLLLTAAYFRQAQVDYWRAPGSMGASRDRCLQQTIRAALLYNLPLNGLDARQQACIHGLLKGGREQPTVFMVQIDLLHDARTSSTFLTDLFVQGQWDEAEVILWCRPSGVIWAFDDLDALTDALADEYAPSAQGVGLTWHRHVLEGDPFAQLTALLQERMFEQVQALDRLSLSSVAELEQAYLALTDPSRGFIEGYITQAQIKGVPPSGVFRLSPTDSFACQSALYELALAQAESGGAAALGEVLDLHSYASQQLRQQLLADHPIDANYWPDDLMLELTTAWGVPGGAGAGTGDGALERRSVSLTQFAIANLASLQGASITAIRHRDDQLIMAWMNADYVKALVERVDIGGTYPLYVAAQLDEPTGYTMRVQQFARQWRSALLFSALRASLHGRICEPSLQAVSDYCAGRIDASLPASMLMPLALRRAPDSPACDVVQGMYVLFNAALNNVILYRPLYGKDAVLEFASIDAMMQAVREDKDLQASLLDWLSPQVRPVYDHGGFAEPHLGTPIVDTSILPAPVAPVQFWPRYWRSEVDLQLYQANRDLLVTLADRDSVSNAESRWALLVQGAWLLFDVASLLVRGPVATVLWLMQMFDAASADVQAVREGSAFERSAALVDMLLNLVMVIGHAYTPAASRLPARLPHAALAPGLVVDAALPITERSPAPAQGKVFMAGALAKPQALLDFSFSGGSGFNLLPPERLRQLEALRSERLLDGLTPIAQGDAAGLYLIEDQHYVGLRGDAYRVTLGEEGVRIVDAQGNPGPWVERYGAGWRIDVGQRLRGGMPKSRIARKREENIAAEARIREQDVHLTGQRNGLGQAFGKHLEEVDKTTAKIDELQALESLDERQRELLDLHLQVRRAQRNVLAKDLKNLIEHDLKHEALLMSTGSVKLSSQVVADALLHQRSLLRQGLIAACEHRYNLLATLINDEEIDAQRRAIAILPETDEEKQQYLRLVASLERVEQLGNELVAHAGRFDTLLESTLKDDGIVFRDDDDQPVNKHHELDKVIEQRRHNAVDVEFRLLEDLGELCLDRLKGSTEEEVADYDELLVSDALRSAGSAHGELAANDLSEEERVAVLNDVIEAYEETIGGAEYLTSTQPALIRQDKLQSFLNVARRLKALATEQMSASVREIELSEPVPQRTPVYAPRGGIRRVVRTQRGRNVVGVEATGEDGEAVVQQRDSHDNVLRTFRRQASQWREVADEHRDRPAVGPAPQPEVLRTQVQALIAGVNPTINMAKRFFGHDEPLGLSTVIDLHVKDLQHRLAQLPRSGQDGELIERAQVAIQELEDSKRDLLVTLYLTTRTPTLNALKYLHSIGELIIERRDRRLSLSGGDYLDTYEIRRVTGRKLWEAHFHYPAEETADREFIRGHLKLWEQRKLGAQAQLRAAKRNQVLKVYRGQLRKGDVEGIIPFE